jgi:hypothetical protein
MLVARGDRVFVNSSFRLFIPIQERESTNAASVSKPDMLQHVFLTKAVSSSKLVPRIRLATQILCCHSQRQPEELYGSEVHSFVQSP